MRTPIRFAVALALTGALVERTPPRRIEFDAPEAAEAILEQLRAWGYLE